MVQSHIVNETKLAEPSSDVAKSAGRGAIYITLAKLWFIASGYGIAVSLTYLLSAEKYGVYRVVINAVSIINAVIVTGTYQTVSKYISQDPKNAETVKTKALGLQVYVGGGAALGFFLLAPVIAALLNDPGLTLYFRIASLITLSYSFYSVYTGYFNGLRRFLTQAAIDATYSTAKLLFIVFLAWLGFGVSGSVAGFAVAAASVLAVSAYVARGATHGGEIRAKDLLTFQSYLLLFTFLLTLLQKVDLMLIKALSSPDAVIASENAGYYGAAIDLANVTYQIIISVTFVIFPLVSRSTFEADAERTRNYISNTLRYSLMIMAITATLFSANAANVLRVVYPVSYQAGTSALTIVAYGILLFGLLYVLTTIITASGRPVISVSIAILTLVCSAGLNALLVPRFGLKGAAIATTAAMTIGSLAAFIYCGLKFGRLMSAISVLRIAGCAGAIYLASRFVIPGSRFLIVGELAVLGIVYLVLLVISREVSRTDYRMIARVLMG